MKKDSGEGEPAYKLSFFYIFFRNLIKKCLCLIRGVRTGTNVYLSPLAVIKKRGKIDINNDVVIERHAELIVNKPQSYISIGEYTWLYSYCRLETHNGWIKIGRWCSVNRFSILAGHGGLEIGDYVRIGPNVIIFASNHIYSDPTMFIAEQGLSCKGIRIENGVWIGAGAIILDGVTIGRGSVVGAGAVVSKDIPPYSVAVGVPARVVKKR